jgi:hypothetical protein
MHSPLRILRELRPVAPARTRPMLILRQDFMCNAL